MNTNVEFTPMMIKCSYCDTVQAAIVEYTTPFATWIHHCIKCKYIIMESEWDIVVPFIMKPTDSIEYNACIGAISSTNIS